MNLPDRVLGPRRIAVIPVHDEEATIGQTLDKLSQVVDEVLVVDDGSSDGTRRQVRAWLAEQGHEVDDDSVGPSIPGSGPTRLLRRGRLLCADQRQGPSAAYRLAFVDLRRRLDDGTLSPDDLVLTMDAAGHHDLDVFDDLQRLAVKERLDALILRRDQSGSPVHRTLGNGLISAWASLWAGVRLHDVGSPYRIFRLAPLTDALDHHRSRRSGHVELAVTLARFGCRVRNDVLVAVPLSSSAAGASWWRGMVDILTVPSAAFRAVEGVLAAAAASDGSAPSGAAAAGTRASAGVRGSARAGAGAGIGTGSGRREGDPASTLARLATPLAATAAVLGAALWLLCRLGRRFRGPVRRVSRPQERAR